MSDDTHRKPLRALVNTGRQNDTLTGEEPTGDEDTIRPMRPEAFTSTRRGRVCKPWSDTGRSTRSFASNSRDGDGSAAPADMPMEDLGERGSPHGPWPYLPASAFVIVAWLVSITFIMSRSSPVGWRNRWAMV